MQRLPTDTRLAVITGSQPDALAAGVILRGALRRAGWSARWRALPPGLPAWGEETTDWLAREEIQALFIVGLAPPVAPPVAGLVGLLVGYRPVAATDWAAVVGGEGWPPVASDAVIAFWLGQALADWRQLAWVAALGAMDALGEQTDQPLVIDAKREHGGQWLREALVLVRAAGRHGREATAAAASLLTRARDPRDLVVAERPERARLQAARAEVEAAVEAAKRLTPTVAAGATVLVLDSACQIQSVLAAILLARAPERPALVANVGAVPDRVLLAVATPPDSPWLAEALATAPAEAIIEPDATPDRCALHLPVASWSSWARRLGLPTAPASA